MRGGGSVQWVENWVASNGKEKKEDFAERRKSRRAKDDAGQRRNENAKAWNETKGRGKNK